MSTSDDVGSASPPKRIRVAQGLAFVALVAALLGALGPADRVRTTYSWPPATLPAGQPDRTWYTPLLLIRHQAETISARIPCELPEALPGARTPVTVLATARRPEYVDGLAVRTSGRSLSVELGTDLLDRVSLPPAGGSSGCAYELRLGQDRWSLEGGPDALRRGGGLETMPKVTGLFSGLDLRRAEAPAIEVTTYVHATRAIARQKLAWIAALLAVGAALFLIALGEVRRRLRPVSARANPIRTAWANAHPADAVVFAVLIAWWVLSPAFWDDGWILERADQYSSSGGFSTYYNGFGTNLPLDFWLEWVQHVLVDISRALIWLRLPALACLAATWVLCRWIAGRVVQDDTGRRGVVLWGLASAFLVGALAWGMTMRPEPVIALLVTAVMACIVRFRENDAAPPLAGVALFVPLALTGHHSGVVSLAPVLVCAPRLLAWARLMPAAASTLATSAIALVLVFLFIGSDLEQRREDTLIHRVSAASWRDEADRYAILSDFPSGTPLRRASVALIALAVLALLVRRRRNGIASSFPTATLALALVLLFATPSKWPWHFGALIGFLAVAVASETAHLRSRGSRAWPYAAIALAVAAAAWAWSPRTAWNAVDLRRLEWRLGVEDWFPLVPIAILLPLLLLVATAVVGRARGRPSPIAAGASSVAPWTAPVLAVPLIVFTIGVLVADSVESSDWTPARQSLRQLRGDPRCGLGDDLLTSVGSSLRPVDAAEATTTVVPAWVPPPPVDDLRRFALAPAAGSFGTSEWFTLPDRGRFGIFVAGTPSPTDRLSVEWGREERGRVVSLGSDPIGVDFISDAGAPIVSWRLLSESELPERAVGAGVIRVTLRSDDVLGAAVAVTEPVSYRNQTLTEHLRADETRSLVNPKLVTYFPCVRQPELKDGAVGVPRHVVASDDLGRIWPLNHQGASPFNGILDLYRLEHRPLGDSRDPPPDVFLYEVVRDIPGAIEAAPTATRWSS